MAASVGPASISLLASRADRNGSRGDERNRSEYPARRHTSTASKRQIVLVEYET
jgi:hypothetical protein